MNINKSFKIFMEAICIIKFMMMLRIIYKLKFLLEVYSLTCNIFLSHFNLIDQTN